MGAALPSGPAGSEFLQAHWATGMPEIMLHPLLMALVEPGTASVPRPVTSTCEQPCPFTPV